jgi:ATP-dependent helicase YprA (DUF1998 family)
MSRPFQQGCAVRKPIDDELLHPLFRGRILSAIQNVYQHPVNRIRQDHAHFDRHRLGQDQVLLSSGDQPLAQLRDADAPPGIVAVLVHPMNALAEDQLLRWLLAGTGISFGMYVGKTARKKSDVSGRRQPKGASRADYERELEDVRNLASGETAYPAEEVCSREEMRAAGEQPRILPANVNQLELLLTGQTDVEPFADVRLDAQR